MKTRQRVSLALGSALLLAACGSQDNTSADQVRAERSGPVEAAASGIVEEVASAAAEQPIPREGLPDYLETAPGGRYLTGMTFSNDQRVGGMVMYSAPGSAAEAIAFHRASMERQGMTVGAATARPVRDYIETTFEGTSADGRSRLTVSVIDKSEPAAIVQLNYADEQG